MPKRKDAVDLSPDGPPPPGYHWFGDKPIFNPETSSATVAILPPSPLSRTVAYAHLYCAVFDESKDKLMYLCCVPNCDRCTLALAIPMVSTNRGANVIFQNFFSHLCTKHPEYLRMNDRPMQNTANTSAGKVTAFFPHQDPSVDGLTVLPISNRKDKVLKKQTDLWKAIIYGFVEVCAHGPFPIHMVCNPAVKQLLVHLKACEESFQMPHRKTLTTHLDVFLKDESARLVAEFMVKFLSNPLDTFCCSFDEWSSRQSLAYLSLCISAIAPDWSTMGDFVLACAPFKFPHAMPDIRMLIMRIFTTVLNMSEDEAIRRVHGMTYDGAAVNECFNPNPNATGLSANERVERRAVCAKYGTIEEATCIEHRSEKCLEHVLNDPNTA
jgi:hypothetical protein